MVDVSDMIELGETLDCILFTDATPSGLGAVLLLPDGSIHTIGRSFNHSSNIQLDRTNSSARRLEGPRRSSHLGALIVTGRQQETLIAFPR